MQVCVRARKHGLVSGYLAALFLTRGPGAARIAIIWWSSGELLHRWGEDEVWFCGFVLLFICSVLYRTVWPSMVTSSRVHTFDADEGLRGEDHNCIEAPIAKWYVAALTKVTGDGQGLAGSTVNLVILLIGIAGILAGICFGLVWYFFDLKWSALTGLLFCVGCLLGVLLLWLAKKTSLALSIIAYSGTAAALTAHFLSGAGPGSSGMLSAYLGPLLLLIFEPSRPKALILFLLTFVVSLAMCILERIVGQELLTPQRPVLPVGWYAFFLWFNVNLSALISFVATSVAVFQLKRNRESLQQSKMRAEELNQQLMQQQQKLELERKVAHIRRHAPPLFFCPSPCLCASSSPCPS